MLRKLVKMFLPFQQSQPENQDCVTYSADAEKSTPAPNVDGVHDRATEADPIAEINTARDAAMSRLQQLSRFDDAVNKAHFSPRGGKRGAPRASGFGGRRSAVVGRNAGGRRAPNSRSRAAF